MARFIRPRHVRIPLQDFLGLKRDEQISRIDVTQRIFEYISEHKLRNGRVVILDQKLKALLNAPDDVEVTLPSMQKYLTPHFYEFGLKEKITKCWSVIRSCVKLLSLHHRAVILANHPTRKWARGEFECEE